MNTLGLFAATGTRSSAETGAPHWPHLDVTGTVVQVPKAECDLAGMDAANPEAGRLVKRIQEALGMTIGQIGQALGCSRQAVHGWMRGRSIDGRNLANLEALSGHAVDWMESGRPKPSSLAWTEKLLAGFAKAGLDSKAGRAAWAAFQASQEERTRRRSRLPTAAELDRLLGSKPVDPLASAHRLADNIRSLGRDARRGR
jgi:hypothetical protein